MDRDLDREIQALRRGTVRDQLAVLWREEGDGRLKVFSYWDAGPWSSPYVIAAIRKVRFRGTLRAVAEIDYPRRRNDVTFLSHQVIEGAPPEVLIVDPREARFRLRSKGAARSPKLCDWIVAIGSARDEIDIPRLRKLADHEDRVVRYTALGALSWNPDVPNDQLLSIFGEDADAKVRELAELFAKAAVARATRRAT